jgi:glycosyltransferase involved in cell wall biosynthesis
VRIAIDIYPAVSDVAGRVDGAYTKTGVGTYTHHLVRELLELDRANEYRLVAFKLRGSPKPFAERENVSYRFLRVPPRQLYTNLLRAGVRVPFDLVAGRADVFLFPNFVRYPLAGPARSVVVVYDVSFLRFPELFPPRARSYLERLVPGSVAAASRVVTISESSKRDIVAELGVPEGKIVVAEPGVDGSRFRPVGGDELERVRAKHSLPERYVLFVGTIEPRKNVDALLRAYESLPDDLRRRYPLVVAGGRGWLADDTVVAIERLAARGELVWTGYVTEDDLPTVYSGASLFAFPSLYEGWGLPVVEAMACGTPAITTTSSSLPEAAGDAAILVDPADTGALAREMERVLFDEELRARMTERGLAHARRFPWRRPAERVLGLFRELADESGRP